MPEHRRPAAAQPREQQNAGPTGGAGRKDDVGRTGMYPATGPFPEGAAEVITPGEINRDSSGQHGQRGVSEDLKRSERLPRRGNEEDKPLSDELGD